MRKSPKGCRAGGRTGRKCLSVVRQENEREDQRECIQDNGKDGTGIRGRDRAIKRAQENKLEVAEMRMLRWMCGVTKLG